MRTVYLFMIMVAYACDGGSSVTPPGSNDANNSNVQGLPQGAGATDCPPGTINNPTQQNQVTANQTATQSATYALFDTGLGQSGTQDPASQQADTSQPNNGTGNVAAAIPNCGPVQTLPPADCSELMNPPEKASCAGKLYDREKKTCIDATEDKSWCGSVTTIEAKFTSPPAPIAPGQLSAAMQGYEIDQCGISNGGDQVPVITLYRCESAGKNVSLKTKVIRKTIQ